MTLYDLPAPAKLNLFLHVVGQRTDGYHLLQSFFRLVTLSDSVSIDLRSDGLVTREGDLTALVPEQDDLTMRAAHILRAATGVSLGAHIQVVKRIPSGAGLGGGSSNAATVLLALNRLWRTGLRREQLMQIGLKLGADVPFFLFGQAGFVQGVGEQIEALKAPEGSYLIFKPAVSIATATVFSDADLTRNTKPVTMTDFSGCIRFVGSDSPVDVADVPWPLDNISDGVVQKCQQQGFGRNDLEAVVLRKYAAVSQLKNWLDSQGIQTRMTGSGSCFFAEKDNPESAQLAFERLLVKMQAEKAVSSQKLGVLMESIHVCDGIQKHPLFDWA